VPLQGANQKENNININDYCLSGVQQMEELRQSHKN